MASFFSKFPLLTNVKYDPELAGQYMDAFTAENPFVDFTEVKTPSLGKGNITNALGGFLPQGVDLEEFKKLPQETQSQLLMIGYLEKRNNPDLQRQLRREELEDLGNFQLKQAKEMEEFGQRATLTGALYKLPEQFARAMYAGNAFLPGIAEAASAPYRNLAGRMGTTSTPYMSINVG